MKQFLLLSFLGIVGFISILGCASTHESSSTCDSNAYLFFTEKCSKCHEIDRATAAVENMNEDEFYKLVHRMSEKPNSEIDQNSIEKIVEFRRANAYLFFTEKCSKCHEIDRATAAVENMNEDEFYKLVHRMSEKPNSEIDQNSIEKVIRFRGAKYKKR